MKKIIVDTPIEQMYCDVIMETIRVKDGIFLDKAQYKEFSEKGITRSKVDKIINLCIEAGMLLHNLCDGKPFVVLPKAGEKDD